MQFQWVQSRKTKFSLSILCTQVIDTLPALKIIAGQTKLTGEKLAIINHHHKQRLYYDDNCP